jgi:D-alanine-D-alanine ligase
LKNICVIFGGRSNENEISIISGTMAANVLKGGGENVFCVYIDVEGNMYTGAKLCDIEVFKGGDLSLFPRAIIANGGIYALNKRGKTKKFFKIDVAINCCHGGVGEGGGVAGLCELANIPLASAGMFESAAFMDKYFTKLVLSSIGVPVLPYVYFRGCENLDEAESLGYPLIIKPCKLGSSIGIKKVSSRGELELAAETALFYDDSFIIEKYIKDKREVNCAAYMAQTLQVSECEEVTFGGDIFSFDDKYSGGAKSVIPADIPKELSDKIKGITAKIYTKLNMRGIVRFDFIVTGEEAYVSEINTVPGSLSYYLLSGGFKEFYPVLCAVIERALADFAEKRDKKILRTGILSFVPSNACKISRK